MRIGKEFNLFTSSHSQFEDDDDSQKSYEFTNFVIIKLYKYVSETETNVVQFGEMNVNYII